MDIQSRIKKITSSWFYEKPLLFSTLCTHQIVPNENINIPMRTGQLRIEYSPQIVSNFSEEQLQNALQVECYRILLGHPYQRQPYNAQKGVLSISSDVIINQLSIKTDLQKYTNELPGIMYLKNQAIRFHILTHPLGIKWIGSPELQFFQRNLQIEHDTGYFFSVDDLTFEQWYTKILFLMKETSIAGESAGSSDSQNNNLDEISELWQENEQSLQDIKNQIKKAKDDDDFDGIGGKVIRAIQKSCDFSFDYRRALTQFRQTIVSPERKLTRMRPSRRYGFKAMGSRYERKANILIAVDVSGSITDESFDHFYHAINNFFFLGLIEKIDLIFFDVNLKNTKPITFTKKVNLSEIKGRGGTNFQPAIDFYIENKSIYSGMILFTDGEGNPPVINIPKANILWILESRIAYEKSKQWINLINGCKSTYLPF